jgi:hypothetical protein
VEVGGGESKNLRLFFDELQTHHTRKAVDLGSIKKGDAALEDRTEK